MNALGHSDVFRNAAHWRMRAEEARMLAEAGKDLEAKTIMLKSPPTTTVSPKTPAKA